MAKTAVKEQKRKVPHVHSFDTVMGTWRKYTERACSCGQLQFFDRGGAAIKLRVGQGLEAEYKPAKKAA